RRSWTGPLSASSALAGKRRAAENLSPGASETAAPRDRVSRPELVLGRGVRAPRSISCGAVPALHAGVGVGTARHRPVRIRALSRHDEVRRPLRRPDARKLGGVAGRARPRRVAGVRLLQQRRGRPRATRRGAVARGDRAANWAGRAGKAGRENLILPIPPILPILPILPIVE